MNIIFSPEAVSDIDSIKLYLLEKAGLETAQKNIDSIFQNINKLTYQANMYRIRYEMNDYARAIFSGPYIIYYCIKEDEQVQILRIFHQSQDIKPDMF